MIRYAIALCLALLLWPILAMGGDAASVTASPQIWADSLTAALSAGQYRIAVGIILAGLVWLLRDKALANLPGRIGAWLASPRGGIVTILAAGALATLTARLLASAALHWQEIPGLAVNCVATGLMAAGGWSVLTKWRVPPVALLLCLTLGSSACNPTQIAGWKGFGHDLRICANPSVEGAINAGAAQLVKAATGESVTKDDLVNAGKGLVASYGIDLAICALEAAARNLGPLIFGGAPESDPRVRLGWMKANAEKWIQ